MGGLGLGDRRLDLLLVGNIGDDGDALDFGRDFLGIFLALVEHGDFRALVGHGARGGGAETGATAGDENGNIFHLHGKSLSLDVSSDGGEWRVANGEWKNRNSLSTSDFFLPIRHSLLTI